MKIGPFTAESIPHLVSSFAAQNWPKPASTFESYLSEQKNGERVIWIAYEEDQLAGYVTLKWHSQYKPFQKHNIPEVMDLNVLPPFQGKGMGAKLLEIAEEEASKRGDVVGIGVGLYEGYGKAQNLYVTRGYLPDGLGITYDYKPVQYGEKVPLDDDLVLWFTKKLI